MLLKKLFNNCKTINSVEHFEIVSRDNTIKNKWIVFSCIFMILKYLLLLKCLLKFTDPENVVIYRFT